MQTFVISSDDLYALVGKYHIENLLLKQRIGELEAKLAKAAPVPVEASPNGKEKEGQKVEV